MGTWSTFVFLLVLAVFLWRKNKNAAQAAMATKSDISSADSFDSPDSSWYLLQEGRQMGPFNLAQLVRFKDQGILAADTLLRQAESDDAIAARNVPGLFSVPTPKFIEEAVEFQTFRGHHDPVRLGKGTVRINGGQLILHGRRRRLFAFARQDEIIPLDRVFDVTVESNLLRFRVEGQPLRQMRLLKMSSEAAANALQACLPEQMSATGAQVKADKAAFAHFLVKSGRPYATIAIIAANLAIYLYVGSKGGGWTTGNTTVLFQYGGNAAYATTQGQWWRLLTATFLHSGLMHVGFNMWALWDSGRVAERLFGRMRYVTLYLMAGLLGSIASINWQQDKVSIGASGAVFGIYGALTAALFLRKELLPVTIATQLRTSGIVFIAYCLFNGFTHEGIDNAAHLGGLLGGAMLGAGFTAPRRIFVWGSMVAAIGLLGIGMVRAVDVAEPVRDEIAFKAFIADYAKEEKRLGEKATRLFKEGHSMTPREFSRRFDEDIISEWKILEVRINSLQRVTPGNRELHDLLASFIETKRDALETLRDSVATNDSLLMIASTQKIKLSNQYAEKLKQAAEAKKAKLNNPGPT